MIGTEPTEFERPWLTLKEAADACDVSLKTIRRRLDNEKHPGVFPNARRRPGPGPEDQWAWELSIEDLLAAGFKVNAPTAPETTKTPRKRETTELDSTIFPVQERIDLKKKNHDLREENHELRKRAEVAEAVSDERQKALDDTRMALRALTAGPPTSDAQTAPDGSMGVSAPSTHDGTSLAGRERLVAWLLGVVALAAVVALIVVLVVTS